MFHLLSSVNNQAFVVRNVDVILYIASGHEHYETDLSLSGDDSGPDYSSGMDSSSMRSLLEIIACPFYTGR